MCELEVRVRESIGMVKGKKDEKAALLFLFSFTSFASNKMSLQSVVAS